MRKIREVADYLHFGMTGNGQVLVHHDATHSVPFHPERFADERCFVACRPNLYAARNEFVAHLDALLAQVRRVCTGAHATNLSEQGVQVGDEFIPCRVKVWAAGNEASFVGKSLGVERDQVGRVMVNEDLTIPGHPEVQVIGDLANFSHQTGNPLPGVSPVAMQQGRHAAKNVLAMIANRKPQRFRYWDKGSMATIGRNKAVADLKYVHLSGLPAWLAWLFVHIMFLVGFRNRLAVFFQWAWAYFTFNAGARLITRNFQAERRPP